MKDDIQDFVNNFLKSNPDQMGRVLPFTRPDDSTHEQLQDAKDINTCIDKISKVAEEMEKYFATKGDELGFAKWTMALCILSGTGKCIPTKPTNPMYCR